MMPVDSCLPVDGMPKMLGEAGHQMGARRGLNNTKSMRRFLSHKEIEWHKRRKHVAVDH